MVVLDRFYQIAEKPTAQVSFMYKAIPITLFVASAMCGLDAAINFDQAVSDFDNHCFLSPVSIQFTNNTLNISDSPDAEHLHLRKLDVIATIWGHRSECYFAEFTPLTSMIFSIIWGTFFIIVGRGGAGYKSDILQTPWKIVYPCIIFSSLFSMVYLASSITLSTGLRDFCLSFKDEFGTAECVPGIDHYTRQFGNGKEQHFYANVQLAKISSYIGLATWLGQILFLVRRVAVMSDFQLELVTISEKEEEQVEHVIEFQDDDSATVDSQV